MIPAAGKKIISLFSSSEFAEFFGKNSRAEVPIIGEVDGVMVSGRIDRLVISRDNIMIIDFKTTRKIPEAVPQAYIKQMDRYAQLLRLQYPAHEISKYILWTSGPRLVQLA